MNLFKFIAFNAIKSGGEIMGNVAVSGVHFVENLRGQLILKI